jgi:two-component system sensor histidine kinase DegS
MTHVAIIGAGRGGTALIEIFHKDPLVKILGVADIRPQAPGLKLAKKLKIPTATDYRRLLGLSHLEVLIDVTGNPEVEKQLLNLRPRNVAVIGGPTARFMWQLIEAQIQSRHELERHLEEYQALFRLYMREAQHAVMEERTRIALDLHDGLVQTLVGLNYKLDLLEQSGSVDPKGHGLFQEMRVLMKNAIEEARQVVFTLKPIVFDKLSLFTAIRSYLKTYERQYGIAAEFKSSGDETRIPDKTKVFLYRILQESLSNVQKHARARQVQLELHVRDKEIDAVIRDDGIGFDTKKVGQDPDKWASFGLRGIEERARLLGGTAWITSRPKQGTTIRVTFPLETSEDQALPVRARGVGALEHPTLPRGIRSERTGPHR